MRAFLRDPLAHFMAAGFLFFLVYQFGPWSMDRDHAAKVIDVDRAALLTYIQYQSKSFDLDVAEARLDAMDDGQLDALIEAYVEEEALHREALALGLERDDYVIKQRLIQKLDFVTRGFAEQTTKLSEADLETFFDANRTDYAIPPSITFAQIFFDAEKRGREDAEAAAAALSRQLDEIGAKFEDAPRYGDRFPYLINYVDSAPSLVVTHFGARAASEILAMPAAPGHWQGPVISDYGAHLVMVRSKRAGRVPDLVEILDRVESDALRDAADKAVAESVRRLAAGYDVRISPDLRLAEQ